MALAALLSRLTAWSTLFVPALQESAPRRARAEIPFGALGMKEHTARHWVPRLIAGFWRCTAAIATRAAVKLPQRRKRPTESGLFLRQRPNSVGSALTPRT